MTDEFSKAGYASRLLLIFLSYGLSGVFGLSLASWGDQVSLIWPPTGIALFALLVWGTRMWPAIALGAFLVNLYMGSSPAGAVAIAIGNTAGPVLAALALRRFGFDRRFAVARDVLLYAGLGAMAGMAVNASVGTLSLILDGALSAAVAGQVWLTWWLGDALGVLVVGPALLALVDRSGETGASRVEAGLAWTGLVVVGLLALSPLSPLADGLPPYLTLPFVIWLALRQHRVHAAWGVLFLAGLAAWSVAAGFGPFVEADGRVEMPGLWTFTFIQAIASLLITTLRGELARALAESRAGVARLHEAEHIVRLGSWELDLIAGRLTWSPEIFRIFELDPARFQPSYENFLAAIHPDDRERVNASYTESLARREPYDIRHRLRMPDGRVKYVHEQGRTDYSGDGTPLRTIGTVQDVTELEEARLALVESEAKFRAFADFTYDWEVWVGPDGDYRFIAPACERITGYPARAFMERPGLMLDLIHPDDLPRARAHFLDLGRQDDDKTTLEFRIRRQDGEERWIEHVCQGVHDADGHYQGRRASNRDITTRKAAEAELDRHRHHLEDLVAERTADLARARDQAEAANRAKSAFLSSMSHELRTPLNAILGFAQLMERDTSLSEEQRGNLATINRGGRHLLELINDVLEISRIESGRAAARNAPFDLDDSLRAIEEMTRVRADAKGLAFTVERIGELPRHVDGDAPRLRRILLNLLSNAVKYTERGEVRLRVTRAGPDRLRFEVADTGPGIAPEERERVFQAFYQTALGEAKGEGTGLGLPISREYARMMGGELMLDSRPGEGCVFHCELPLPAVSGTDAETVVPSRVIRLRPGQRAIDVLVVEDNPDNRELLVRLLQRVGFGVRAATDGAAAVAECVSARPDFIWMDMRMPGMDGYQATRRIRALPGGGEIRIAALTASAFRENRADILAAGCDDMVAKPLDTVLIFETMARLLGIEYEYEQPSRPAPAAPPASALPPLPEELANALRAAAEALDIEAARALLARVETIDAGAAATLRGLLDEFRFEDIPRLLAGGDGTPPT